MRHHYNCFNHEVSISSVVQSPCAVRVARVGVCECARRPGKKCRGLLWRWWVNNNNNQCVCTCMCTCVQHYNVYPPCVRARPARRRSALVCARAATRAGTVSTGTTAERQRHCKPSSTTLQTAAKNATLTGHVYIIVHCINHTM